MKQILISIKPEWVAAILNGEKTIEIRKTAPKCELPIDVYIYCTKPNAKTVLSLFEKKARELLGSVVEFIGRKCVDYPGMRWSICNGKVVAKFTLRKVEEIICRPICGEWESYTKTLGYSEISQASCLENREIVHYLRGNNGYAWHISNLEIFDKPKELSELSVKKKYKSCFECPHYEYDSLWHCQTCKEKVPLKRAPQSWCYVEEEQ